MKTCLVCKKEFERPKKGEGLKHWKIRKFCSYKCSYLGRKINIGLKWSEETKKKMSMAKKGKYVRELNPFFGKKHTDENKKKMSEIRIGKYLGKNHPRWKGGITPIHISIRSSKEYKLWRKSVYERDEYKCIWCGEVGNGKNLNADHIKTFAYFPELRFAIDNGRTLCVDCHRKTDTYGWKSKNYNLVEITT